MVSRRSEVRRFPRPRRGSVGSATGVRSDLLHAPPATEVRSRSLHEPPTEGAPGVQHQPSRLEPCGLRRRRRVARPPRLEIAGGTYHVTARGNERAAIVRNSTDRRAFLELLGSVREEYGWRVLSYCLMNNHYHLLVQTAVPNLSRGMRQLNGVYAQWFNRRYRRVGHLFQGRYGARLVQRDEHLLAAVRYIVMNPVSAGLCLDPNAWGWSSHRATLGLDPPGLVDIETVLSYFAADRARAREMYSAHVEGAASELPAHPLVDGDREFVEGRTCR